MKEAFDLFDANGSGNIEVKDLKVSYGKIQAIKGISLNVKQGEIVTLVGANGAGKTTLLNNKQQS